MNEGVKVKNTKESQVMRDAGQILAGIMREILSEVVAGISTKELDEIAADLCKKNNVKPGFLGYRDYPAVGCFGVNDTVVHGIPSFDEVLSEGDLLSIDMGIIYKSFYSDMAVTKGVGDLKAEDEKLISVTSRCLENAIKEATLGNRIGDISNAIQTTAEDGGFSVVREMVGHGIGKELHEAPQIPGFGEKNQGVQLESGMTLAIEAIINQGSPEIKFLKDGWTTKTADGKSSALFEHTVLITEKGPEILTNLE